MKVAVSIPDPVFERADRLAKRMNLSRSRVYARALDEFVERHEPEWDIDAINAVLDELREDVERDAKLIGAAGFQTVLKHTEW